MKTLVYGALLAALTTSAAHANGVAGYLYTTLNGEGTNHVISFERHEDGSIAAQRAFSTNAQGGANRAVGGDAVGDFDSQGAVQIIGDYLLAVNAGGNSLSVFGLNRANGALTHVENVGSGGTRPVSIAFTPKAGSDGDYWVVVGNQWNNPNVQKGGSGEGPIEMYPNAEFHADGGGHEAVLDERNIHLFSFNSRTGALVSEHKLASYAGTNGGPTTVAFNRDGSKVAVATWGIAHFATENPTHMKPSRVYVYDFDGTDGTVGSERYFEEEGVAGSIGFSWDPDIDALYVSNFNLATDKRNHSLTVLTDNGSQLVKTGYFGTGEGDDIDEACWTAISPDGDNLYVSSFGGNLISEFDIDQGTVTPVGENSETAFVRRANGTPPGDTKDMYVSPDGRSMYVLGAFQTFSLSSYDIAESGALSLRSEVDVEVATEEGAGAYNFLGLAGFDK